MGVKVIAYWMCRPYKQASVKHMCADTFATNVFIVSVL